MNDYLQDKLTEQFQQQFSVSLAQLLQPISDENPCGKDLRSNGVYHAIHEARKYDDPSLPRGVWIHDLKKSNWQEVRDLSLDALQHKTKDLQIGFWLLESQIHQHQYEGMAPCLLFIKLLCERYWEQIHPQIIEGDIEYRTNPIAWANEKLLPALRLVEITQSPKLDDQYSWADWELATQREQYRESNGKNREKNLLTTQDILNAITQTSTPFYQSIICALADSLMACEALDESLEDLCGSESPGLLGIRGLLEEIFGNVSDILEQRGVDVRSLVLNAHAVESDADQDGGDAESFHDSHDSSGSRPPSGPISNRTQAYTQLAEAAEFLMKIEPHSPVPYLVRRAIQWGNLNTAELYQELFVQFQGQLNIFEVLGLEIKK